MKNIFKIIGILLLLESALYSYSNFPNFSKSDLVNIGKKAYDKAVAYKKEHFSSDEKYSGYAQQADQTDIEKRILKNNNYHKKTLSFPIGEITLFNNRVCNQVIKDKVFTACYNYKYKISTVIGYSVNSNTIKNGSYIKKRPRFYEDKRIPTKYRAYWGDYRGGVYDRGHSRSHASTNWNSRAVYDTYVMSNILPQTPTLNRKAWLKAEKYERLIAAKFGNVSVLNIADTRSTLGTIGKHKITVPVGYYKIIYNKPSGFKKCFYYRNTFYSVSDKLRSHVIDCNQVEY